VAVPRAAAAVRPDRARSLNTAREVTKKALVVEIEVADVVALVVLVVAPLADPAHIVVCVF
jgi:hypothetical protein